MKRLGFVVAILLSLTACTRLPIAEKAKPAEIILTPPTPIPSGLVRLANPNQFIDTSSVKRTSEQTHLISFDVIENLTKAEYVYPEQPQQYAMSSRKTFLVNCESRGLSLVETAYYTAFWGKGSRSPVKMQRVVLAKVYKNSPYHILGQVICTDIYRHQP
ncbi:surface-adhesin E family protein [Pasteurella sp. P03HT]